MQLPELEEVRLLERYKRFLADVEHASGATSTVHCPNTGAMTGCAEPGSRAWISTSDNPKRKYPSTLEFVETASGIVGINSARANRLVREALEQGLIPSLEKCGEPKAEAAIPGGGGRFDWALSCADVTVYIEVKSATLHLGAGLGAFPDAVSERALKHVAALEDRVRAGDRGVLVFCSQHAGIERVRPAFEIYPDYAVALEQAMDAGVEVFALGCRIDLKEIVADRVIEFFLR